ncbi:MAG TPA: DegT/DnrJ/EryC1/StrS family aminotransferase [Firmicutes bacterium]|nr:DegT/DnrJ/EryC1/StrS family aminotransferase [Bacillota bacterium]
MKKIKISEPQLDAREKKILSKVIDSKIIASGSYVSDFEDAFARFLGSKFAVATTSGTTALHAALLALGVGKGDIVVTTPYSFIATSNSVLFTGAKPVFIDIEENSFNIDLDNFEEYIEKHKNKISSVIIVHLYGNPVDMFRVNKICRRYGIRVIEDCAQSHGASIKDKLTGTFGLTGCFSFYATKNMTTGEGGMVVTDDKNLNDLLRKLINHGRKSRFEHDILGYNFRMTNLQAGLGIVQLEKLSRMTELRIKNAEYLSKNLKKFAWINVPGATVSKSKHVYHQYTIRVPASCRERLVEFLNSKGIDVSTIYPFTIPEQPLYRRLGYSIKNLPVSMKVSREVISLPVHPGLKKDDLDLIINSIGEFDV